VYVFTYAVLYDWLCVCVHVSCVYVPCVYVCMCLVCMCVCVCVCVYIRSALSLALCLCVACMIGWVYVFCVNVCTCVLSTPMLRPRPCNTLANPLNRTRTRTRTDSLTPKHGRERNETQTWYQIGIKSSNLRHQAKVSTRTQRTPATLNARPPPESAACMVGKLNIVAKLIMAP
jgi:hypothetical protein